MLLKQKDIVTTFGIEYTFIPLPGVRYRYQKRRDIREALATEAWRSTEECGALEVPSEVHRDLEAAHSFQRKLYRHMRRHRYAPTVTERKKGVDVVHGTGGGHIHLGLESLGTEKEQMRVATNIWRFVADRPWLTWVFNEWLDATEARPLLNPKCSYEQFGLYSPLTPSDFMSRNHYGTAVSLGWKSPSYGADHKYTIEFRMFDAPKNWRQVEEHLAFAMAIFRYAQAHKCLKLTRYSIKLFRDEKTTRADFKATCKLLGLPWGRYRKYMQNFRDRRDFGKLV